MPDWLSHILIGLILARLFRIKKKGLVVLGSLLPDFIVKVELLSLLITFPAVPFLHIYHTPVMGLLLAALLTPFFHFNRLKTFLFIALGIMGHIFSDLFTKHFIGGTMLLFPFSWKTYRIDLLWSDQYYLILVPLLIVYLAIKYFQSGFRSRRR